MAVAGGPWSQLPLFGVIGLERLPGISGSIGIEESGGRRRRVLRSRRTIFEAVDGSSVAVTSHLGGEPGDYESIKTWAPMNPYRATARGQRALDGRGGGSAPLGPVAVEWVPTTISVSGEDLPFEVCQLDEGCWAAIGRITGTIVTLDGRGVPPDAVHLMAIDEHPVSDLPDLGPATGAVREDLDRRYDAVPFQRVRRWAD